MIAMAGNKRGCITYIVDWSGKTRESSDKGLRSNRQSVDETNESLYEWNVPGSDALATFSSDIYCM